MPFLDFGLLRKAVAGFYFHIPFCPHICPYCDFIKTSRFSRKDINIYFHMLTNQLETFLQLFSRAFPTGSPVTVYFGGGTPGLFPASFYVPLLNCIRQNFQLLEITIETNPFTNSQRFFQEYRAAGFDRLTLGAQSLCPQVLQTLGRRHTAEMVLENLHFARKAGFENIQVDLIYGLKKGLRTLPVHQEIQLLEEAGASGISAYALSIEKRTLFTRTPEVANADVAVDEYFAILDTCHKFGFLQQETSNFSRVPTLHNDLYWHGRPYAGIGTGAHGLLPASKDAPFGNRYRIGKGGVEERSPGNDLLVYADEKACKDNFFIEMEPPRTHKEYVAEMVFTLLRTEGGIPFSWLEHFPGPACPREKLLKNPKISRAVQEGKILWNENEMQLESKEKIRGDAWAVELIYALE